MKYIDNFLTTLIKKLKEYRKGDTVALYAVLLYYKNKC